MKPTGTSSARLAAVTVLLGAGVTIASQFVAAYVLEDPFGLAIETVNLFDKHGSFVVLASLVAVGALIWAVLAGSRKALIPVLGMGIAIVLVFLLIDLPDAGETGLFDTPGAGNLDSTGVGAAGLWLEMVGGLVVILGSISLMTLDSKTIASIRPGRNGRRRTRRKPRVNPPASGRTRGSR